MSEVRKLLKESTYTVISQFVSLCSGIILSFLLPKYISVSDYGYWQFFILLTTFTGIFLLGFGDGVFLMVGGEKFTAINRNKWFPQIWVSFSVQIVIAICLFLYAYFFVREDGIKKVLFYILSIYIIIENFFKVLAFILMATDKIIRYSRLVMIDKAIISISVIILIILGDVNVLDILIVYTLSHLIILLVCLKSDFSDIFKYWSISKYILSDYITTLKLGFILTLSNIVGMFIVGSGRFIIEYLWNIEVFAKVSLALSISSFLLFFVSQISYVLYPFLRNSETETQSTILKKGVSILTFISILIFVFIFPLYYVIQFWLPDYHSSLKYLIILAPLSLFEIKNNLLYLTYFKNLCKIKELFLINLTTVIVAVVLYIICAFFKNIDALVLSILMAIIVKSTLLQVTLYKHYDINYDLKNLWEFIVVAIFIYSYYVFGISFLCIIYIVLIMVTIYIYKQEIQFLMRKLPNLLKRDK